MDERKQAVPDDDGRDTGPGERPSEYVEGASELCTVEQALDLVSEVGPEPAVELLVQTRTEAGMHHVIDIRPDADSAGWPDSTDGTPINLAEVRSIVTAVLDLSDHESGSAVTRVQVTFRGPRVTSCQLRADWPGTDRY